MIVIKNAQNIQYMNSTFEIMTVKGHLLDIFNIFNFTLYNVSFDHINTIERNQINKLRLGGCIRTENVLSREITFLKISNVFSDETTVGIKIIDISMGITSLIVQYDKTIFDYKVKVK